MTKDEILHVPSMPASAPSYPRGPYRFVRREYLIVTYETDPDALRAALPEPLEPAPGNIAYYELLTAFAKLGPPVTMATPDIPVRRPHPSAMCTAAASCLT
jgi:acetoacetate decarboxylase